jgi:hypothetical protein
MIPESSLEVLEISTRVSSSEHYSSRTCGPIGLSARFRAPQACPQIPDWKQYNAKDSAAQVEVMSGAVLLSPLHRWKQSERLTDMGKTQP